MIIIYIALSIIGIVACYLWWKLCMFFYRLISPKKAVISNPYIEAHKAKIRNDKWYDEYIFWMEKNGHGVPIQQIKSPEDIEAEKKIKNLIR